jgi:hypothetical protein
MLLASNIGFLALVAPGQIFFAVYFDPERSRQSDDEYKSFTTKGNIYQCLINTYYAASFVFCFTSSSLFRRELNRLLNKHYKPKLSIIGGASETYSPNENRPFLQQPRLSGLYCSNGSPNNGYILERRNQRRLTESTMEIDRILLQ